MSYGTTLFAHIAHTKLQSQIEDTAVEALGYILTQSPTARRALTDFLSGEDFDIGYIHRVATWKRDEQGAIPDLVCFDEYNSNHVLIEAKFFADLTKNQPNQYLRQLQINRKKQPAALLFIAPESRLESLWPYLCERAREEKPKIELSIISDSGELRSASISDGKHRLLLTSWAALLGSMETQACEDGDTVAVGDLKQLRGLTDDANPDPYISWSQEELRSKFARRMEGLRRLVEDAIDHGNSAGFLKRGNVAAGGAGGFGRSIQIGRMKAWFGIEVFSWAKFHSTPLWLRLDGDGHGQLKGNELTERMFSPGRGWSFRVPIELPPGVEYAEILSSVVRRLKSIALQLEPDSIATADEYSDIRHLQGGADRMDPYAFLPWRPEELEPNIAQQVTGLHGTIDEVARRGKVAGILQHTRAAPRQEGFGQSIRFGDLRAWLGIHLGAWARHGHTPLWLVFENDEEPQLADVTAPVHEVDWKRCIPIDVPPDAKSEKAVISAVDRLKSIADQLKGSNGRQPAQRQT